MLQLHFDPFPTLVTKRLVLRHLAKSDVTEIMMLRSNDAVNKYLDRPKSITLEEASQFILKINNIIASHEGMYWAIQLKNDPKLIGTICYWNIEKEKHRAEIGYELHPGFQGKGIMQEAVEEIIRFGFENMRLQTITAFPHHGHDSSIKLLEKKNFARDEKLEVEMVHEAGNHFIYVLQKPA